MRQRLHREPRYIHPRLKFLPNIVINLISLIISLIIVGGVIYIVMRYLVNKFYHLD